jgi:AcrR family transcriptional regulator
MSERTRQQIMEATARILRVRGLVHATTREIAREAGYAEGTLYKHFECKEELLLAVLQERLPDLLDVLEGVVAGSGRLEANLERIALAVLRYYDGLVPVVASLMADAELLQRYRRLVQMPTVRESPQGPLCLHERLALYLLEEQRSSRLAAGVNPFALTALLLGACFEYVFLRHLVGEPLFAKAEEQFVAELVRTLPVSGAVSEEA